MRILAITPFLPDRRARSGGPQAMFDRIELLSRDHSMTLVTLAEPGQRDAAIALAGLDVRVLAVVRRPVVGARAAWRKRIRLAVGLLVDRRPMLVQEFGSATLCATLRTLTASETFDAVLIEHLLAAQCSPCLAGSAAGRVILTDHDVRGAFPPPRPPGRGSWGTWRGPLARLERIKWRGYARWAYSAAAVVAVPTEADAQVVRSEAPRTIVAVVPFGLSVDRDPHPADPAASSATLSGAPAPPPPPPLARRERPVRREFRARTEP